MITLAFGQMAYFFMVSLSAYGGDDGLTLQARSTLFGVGLLADDISLFYVVLAVLALPSSLRARPSRASAASCAARATIPRACRRSVSRPSPIS